LHSRKKKTKIVNWSSHFEHVDVMSVITSKSMIVCFENIIKRFHHFENAVRVNVKMLDQFNKWMNKEIAIQWRDWLYAWKTFFFMKSLNSFCLKIEKEERAMWILIESSVETTAKSDSEIEAKARAMNTKSMHANIFKIDRDHV
jgi:hypothetical protein